MDALRDAVNNISLYDVKAAVRKAQNVVMNYTEMESKVREATNNEPWGASSTLMNEIASGTFNYQLLNEIMPMIYKRFTEKSAEEWRQIYKALQLLEFLVKNGSEQVIDDARSHLSTIKMLRQFYFIDANGKDQGINVRNRAKELAELLSDVDRIRSERKKSRSTRNKYGGVEGGSSGFSSGMGGLSSDGNGFGRKYGGFGSDQADFGGYSGGAYGDGGGFGGASSSRGGFHDDGYSGSRSGSTGGSQKFQEYDEYEEDTGPVSRPTPRRQQREREAPPPAAKPPPPKKAPEVDLFSFDEPAQPSAPTNGKQKQATSALDDFGTLQSGGADDDDFDDFQSATPAPVAPATTTSPLSAFNAMPPLTSSASQLSIVQPKPVSTNQQSGLDSLVGFTSPPPAAGSAFAPPSTGSAAMMSPMSTGSGMSSIKPTNSAAYQPAQPNYYTSVPANFSGTTNPLSPNSTGTSVSTQGGQKKVGNDAFGNIWNKASSGIKKPATPTGSTPSLQAMAKEKATAGIWGAPAATPSGSSGFGGSSTTTRKTGGDLDDLLG